MKTTTITTVEIDPETGEEWETTTEYDEDGNILLVSID